MIVPSGKIRRQINQGEMKNSFLLDNEEIKNPYTDLFPNEKKIAFTPGRQMTQDPPGQKPLDRDLQSVMNDSQDPGISGKIPGENRMEGIGGGNGPPMPSADAVQPQGQNRWLVPDGSEEDEQANQDIAVLEEKRKLREVAGPGVALNMKRTTDGMFELTLMPPRGQTFNSPDDFAATLMQAVGGVTEEITDPDPMSGAMKVVYRSKLMGPPRIEKAKGKRGRR